MSWLWLLVIPIIVVTVLCIRRLKPDVFRLASRRSRDNIRAQLAMLEERTKYLQGLEEKIERIRDKQDADSRELRERLYGEYSRRLQGAVNLLKETYAKMSQTTASAFREITNRNAKVYKQTARQLVSIAGRLESL